MMQAHTKKWIPVFMTLFLGLVGWKVLADTSSYVGSHFPGYLRFENGVVGAFFMPSWSGHTQGYTYQVIDDEQPPTDQVLTKTDYMGVVVLPWTSGVLFFLLGLMVFWAVPREDGRLWLLFLHFLIAAYLMLTPDFHLSYRFSYLLLGVFSLIPATAIRFAQTFPKRRDLPKIKMILPWAVSLGFFGLHLFWFDEPRQWIWVERALFVYVIVAYGYWLWIQIKQLQQPQQELLYLMASYQIRGQVVAFALPLVASIAIFVGNVAIPLNFLAPLILLFPMMFMIGILIARAKYNQMQLVRVERRATLGNLMTGLAHEINNPLNFIYAAMDPLQEHIEKGIEDDALKKSAFELTQAMEEGVGRIKSMVDGFRLYAHPGNAKKSHEDIQEILLQTLALIQPQWNKTIEIEKHFEQLPTVPCRKTELGQVFMNVLHNAEQSIEQKGKITLSTKRHGDTIDISIKDTGKGMTNEQRKRIFDPFYTTKDQGEGTGLGMMIVQEIIDQHNGSVEISSKPDQGTIVTLRLPLS